MQVNSPARVYEFTLRLELMGSLPVGQPSRPCDRILKKLMEVRRKSDNRCECDICTVILCVLSLMAEHRTCRYQMAVGFLIDFQYGLWYNIHIKYYYGVSNLPKPIRELTSFYHQTSIEHLQSIIDNGLLSRADILRRGIKFNDVADPNIIERRFESGLENYVPFHFHPRTPFDYKIRENNPNKRFMYLTIYRNTARELGALILPSHPLSNLSPTILSYDEGMKAIDWDIMERTSEMSGYNAQVRMAECLFASPLKVSNVSIIYVKDISDKEYVERILDNNRIRTIKVYVQSTFF